MPSEDGIYACDGKDNDILPVCNWGNLVICAKCGLIFIQESVDNKDYTYTVVGLGEYKPLEDVTKKVTTKHLEILVEVEIPSAFLNRT